MKTKQEWKKKTRKIFVSVFGIVANSKNLIGMRTYTYRWCAFINIADRWNVYLCSWLLELVFAINKGN